MAEARSAAAWGGEHVTTGYTDDDKPMPVYVYTGVGFVKLGLGDYRRSCNITLHRDEIRELIHALTNSLASKDFDYCCREEGVPCRHRRAA
jgi:hypothetical protein